jgi:hypothetical protein
MSKLPQITLAFWIMKICATTLGETAGDLLSMTMNVGYAVSSMILIGLFLASLVSQLASKKYHPALYWTVILSTSTAGTTMSDYMDRTLGLGYTKGAIILLSILLAIFAYWRWTEGSLSVNNIKTFKAELLYWIAILFSNTLGTALGDFLADDSGLGFAGGRRSHRQLAGTGGSRDVFHQDFQSGFVLGRLCSDASVWRDDGRCVDENERQRRAEFWHHRLLGGSGEHVSNCGPLHHDQTEPGGSYRNGRWLVNQNQPTEVLSIV